MPAFQIQIAENAALDGATAFSWPSALPAPTAGVYVLAAGSNVNVGTIDLDAIPSNTDQLKGWWLKALHIEAPRAPTGCAGLRARCRAPSQNTDFEVMPDLVVPSDPTTAINMHLRTLFPECFLPRGSTLVLLGTSDQALTTPLDGPYNVYFEIEPIRDDRHMVAVQACVAEAKNKAKERGSYLQSFQGTATDAQERYTVTRRCVLVRAFMSSATLPAAGESMRVEISRIQNGSLDASADAICARTLDSTNYTTVNSTFELYTATSATGSPARRELWLNPGDTLRINRDYTAGGGPTPMVNTNVVVELAPLPTRPIDGEGIDL